jgi:hypothetical protein
VCSKILLYSVVGNGGTAQLLKNVVHTLVYIFPGGSFTNNRDVIRYDI